MPPAPPPAAPPPPAPQAGGRSVVPRLAGVLLLAVLAAGGWWWVRARGTDSPGPAEVFDHVRDRTLAGDGGALWRLMLPPARRDYEGFVENMRRDIPPEYAAEYRRKTGLTPEDLRRLKPEEILSLEQVALAEEMYRGSRVYDQEVRGDGALLRINLGDGSERTWYLRRDPGGWKIDNLRAVVDGEGRLLARPNTTVPPEWKEPRAGEAAPGPKKQPYRGEGPSQQDRRGPEKR